MSGQFCTLAMFLSHLCIKRSCQKDFCHIHCKASLASNIWHFEEKEDTNNHNPIIIQLWHHTTLYHTTIQLYNYIPYNHKTIQLFTIQIWTMSWSAKVSEVVVPRGNASDKRIRATLGIAAFKGVMLLSKRVGNICNSSIQKHKTYWPRKLDASHKVGEMQITFSAQKSPVIRFTLTKLDFIWFDFEGFRCQSFH